MLAHDNLNLDDLEIGYLKNLELDDTTVNTGSNLEDRDVNLYVTQVYQHDSTHDANGFKAPAGSPQPGGSWRYWFWNFHGSQMGWQSNLRHQMYIEGRLDSRLLINNIRITGSKQCSGIKSTRSFVTIRNSYLSAMLDEQNLAVGHALGQDRRRGERVGNRHLQQRPGGHLLQGTLGRAQRARLPAGPPRDVGRRLARISGRELRSTASAPDDLDSRQRASRPDRKPSSTPTSGRSCARTTLADPANPYSFKKYVAYNRFRWINDEGRRQSVFRDDGTAPREAV